MATVLKKYKSMVFSKNFWKTENGRRRCAVSESDRDEGFPMSGQQRRTVTFADIEELHTKFGISNMADDIAGGGTMDKSITNIGYINRNCAEYINKLDPLADESLAAETPGTLQEQIEDKCNQGGGTKGHNITSEPVEVTFGKRGKNVGEFRDATNITYLAGGDVLITDMVNGRIQLCSRNGVASAVFGGNEISEPWSTCITSEGHIALTSRRQKVVKIISKEGDVLWSFGAGFFQRPTGLCVNSEGNFIVADTLSNRVSIHDSAGKFVKYIGNQKIEQQCLSNPRYVCVSPRDDILVSDSGHHCVKMFDKNGNFIRSIGVFGKNYGELKTPYGICTDKLGHVLVADHYNNRVSMFTADGAFVCHVVDESHGIVHPKGLALSKDMNLYVSVGHLKACEIKVFKLKNADPTFVVSV